MKNNPSKKRQLLKELRSQGDIVSGEQLSATLGISRVSVWKHIQKLQEQRDLDFYSPTPETGASFFPACLLAGFS
jgi:predicted ArsR family transcriptional regulator